MLSRSIGFDRAIKCCEIFLSANQPNDIGIIERGTELYIQIAIVVAISRSGRVIVAISHNVSSSQCSVASEIIFEVQSFGYGRSKAVFSVSFSQRCVIEGLSVLYNCIQANKVKSLQICRDYQRTAAKSDVVNVSWISAVIESHCQTISRASCFSYREVVIKRLKTSNFAVKVDISSCSRSRSGCIGILSSIQGSNSRRKTSNRVYVGLLFSNSLLVNSTDFGDHAGTHSSRSSGKTACIVDALFFAISRS